ncbi:MAG: malonyl-ACP O-methyltransferase BioC [Rickettsiales endosymbiont of Dermacentor nuttalli]
MQQKFLVKKSFDKSALNYNKYAWLQKEIANELLAISFNTSVFANICKFNILDVGCGTGYLSESLLEKTDIQNITQLDLSFNMCEVATKRNRGIATVNGDIEALPFAKDAFDIITSSSTFQWLQDINIGLKEIFRVLKSQGMITFSTFGYNTLRELRQSFALIDDEKHINDFIKDNIIKSAMLDLGFTELKLVKCTKFQYFNHVLEIMRYLHNLGAAYKGIRKNRTLFSKRKLEKLNNLYKENFSDIQGLITSWEIYYFIARKP